jgi:dynein heavy chain 2, cytosolic
LFEKLSFHFFLPQKLTSLNADFFDVKIMSARWNPFAAAITIPNSNNLDDYQMAMEKLPDFDSPQLYGLPASTNISKDVIFCRNLLKTLRSKYMEDDSGFDFERRLKPILTMWRKLTAVSIDEDSHKVRTDF